MNATLIDRIETGAERCASALFAAAVGYAAYEWLGGSRFQSYAVAAALGFAAGLLCNRVLKRLEKQPPRLRVPVFDLREFDAFSPDELLLNETLGGELVLTDTVNDELLLTERVDDELLLTEADRLPVAALGDPLVLDDVLAAIGPDSRVVRLFDRTAMPTPGQLQVRIDDHLGQGSAAADLTDASQALSDALAELKRSLR
jgi:hypothetical protein